MKRILVPTDLSANSKAGILFAVQLASQSNATIDFIYTFNLVRQFNWSDEYFEQYRINQSELYRENLNRFIDEFCATIPIKVGSYSCALEEGILPDVAIMQYCQKHPEVDCICMSTQGAGNLGKLLGTNTGNLITKSEIPVIAVPPNCNVRPIKYLLYATDLDNYESELGKVFTVADSLAAEVEVLHINVSDSPTLPKEAIESIAKKQSGHELKLYVEEQHNKHSFSESLRWCLNSIKPDMVIMFVNQNRSFAQRLFQPSNTENLSFALQIPLLSFNKRARAIQKTK